MKDWVNIKTNITFAKPEGVSPVVKCLMKTEFDEDLFKRWLAEGLPDSLSMDEKQSIVSERLNKVIEWRAFIDDKFSKCPSDKNFCLFSLGHLISAHYSGKAQSFSAIGYTLAKLTNAISERQPIVFTFCFGGYKCHTSKAYPEVDWAELFNLNYLISYLYPIINEYKYGVEIEYESEEVSIQFNNVPQKQTNKYTESFKRLVEYYIIEVNRKYGLSLNLKLVIARELYKQPVEKLYELMGNAKQTYYDAFNNLSTNDQEKWLQRAESNFMWENGIKSYGSLSESEKYEIIKEARITNEAFLEADYVLRESWFENPYRIPLTGTWGRMPSAQPIDGWLHIKSTAASVVDCWIGTGFLEAKYKNGIVEYIETILSKSQVESLSNRISCLDNFDTALHMVSKNFLKVPVFTNGGLAE